MKLRGVRAVILTVVPLAVAAATLIGPMAVAANALPVSSCDLLWAVVYEDWNQAQIAEFEAETANDRGDWLAWAYYNSLAAHYASAGDVLAEHAVAVGC
jgi:hypothetical protein